MLISFKKWMKQKSADLKDFLAKTFNFSWQESKQNLAEIYMRET